ncbi:MAG: hypothetical protein PVF87_00580 [Acidimicrobiia bacterium]|jgi:hypothetical protein
MSLEFNQGWLYTLTVRRHAKLSNTSEINFSDLEFVELDHIDDTETVTLIDLEYVGPGHFEWATESAPVFLDRSEIVRGEKPVYRMFRESRIIAAEATQPD